MQLQKLISLRDGQRRLVSRQLEKFDGELTKSEFQRLLQIVTEKAEDIKVLNEKIINHADVTDVATELEESGEYSIDLEMKIHRLQDNFKTLDHITENQGQNENNHCKETENLPSTAPIVIEQVSDHSVQNNSYSVGMSSHHKLPKLNLPTFDGSVAKWQTFWDSFESAVHQNPSLSDVQKFNYLRSLLHDSALTAIDGFPMTNANYVNAIEILKQRFGQTHKIVDTYIQSLLDLPAPCNDVTSLRNFYDKIETYVRGLESLGQCQESYGNILVPIIIKRLPTEIQRNLAREHGDSSWQLHDLRAAIRREIQILEACPSDYSQEYHTPTASFFAGAGAKKRSMDKKIQNKGNARNQTNLCSFCSGKHTSVNCEKFKTLTDRLSVVKSKRLCYNCLGSHQVALCRSKYRCQYCRRKHHSSICDQSMVNSTLNPHATPFERPVTGNTETSAILHSTTQHKSSVLLKTAVAQVKAHGNTADANILFDEGAQRSFISQTLAEKLQLEQMGSETISLASFGGNAQQYRSIPTGEVYLQTESGDNVLLKVLIIPKIAVPLTNLQSEVRNLKYIKHLKLAHPITDDHPDFEVSLLIGADHYWQIVQNKIVRGNGPTAVKSKIGYLLSGPLPINTKQSSSCVLNVIASPPNQLDLEQFWKLETMGINPEELIESKCQTLHTYKDESISYQNGHYVAKLPWKEDHPQLPTNFNICKKRTENTICRLSKEPELLQKYGQIIEDQLKRGFIEKVDTTVKSNNQVHYIPHHAVKKNSATTPVRIVYDCSCRESNDQPSLNDCLSSTPPELNDLTGILIRFRMHKYAAATDIEKAFLNIGLDEKDRDATRFLWLNDPSDPQSKLSTYRFKAILFGATCSPFILSATILKHLESNSNNLASDYLRKDLYVDNALSSFKYEPELIQHYTQSRELMSAAGFNLRSWSSNSNKLCIQAAKDNVLDSETSPKVLGMRWNTTEDTLEFLDRQIQTNVTTKREILQQTSKFYDPLGLLSPVTVRSKILLQELWQRKFDWDMLLPDEIQERWYSVKTDLNSAIAMKFPRYYFDTSTEEKHLLEDNCIHIFCDASMLSYGAVSYISNGLQSTLMMAKTRVAPLKTLTLPRLELMAAVVGARLCKHLRQNTSVSKFFLWSDSQIVLQWVKTAKTLNRFIKNRVTEIHTLTQEYSWMYCPSKDNPADLLTRGVSTKQLKQNNLWFYGPKWLNKPSEWPRWTTEGTNVELTVVDDEHLVVSNHVLHQSIPSVVDMTRYSKLAKLLRVVAYILRFINNCKVGRNKARLGPLTAEEISKSEVICIRISQTQEYQAELDSLRANKRNLPLIKQLQLFLENDTIRCRGRLQNAPLDKQTKHPYLLPSKHSFTRLVIRDAHERLLHDGTSATITFVRQRYWIPAIRQCVRSELRKCIQCKKVVNMPYTAPDPPPLPKSRVADVEPFTYTGVDFSGALQVKDANGRETKAYICLFTCATTRAVHLELVPDLTAETFIQAFRRLCSRKSMPKIMMSDNATTFTSASKQLQKLVSSTAVQEELNGRGIEWRLIPKRAPWFGGWWERLIGITKTALKKVLWRSYISYQALQTVLTEIEAVINDRPLTYVTSGDINEPEALTPAHLLYGRRITRLPYGENQTTPNDMTTATKSSTVKQAAQQKKVIEDFRQRWRHEYLTALRERHQTTGHNQQRISIGDIVQVHDDSPRSLWKLARIEELITGNDGLIRAAKIRTQNGLTNRAIVKLYPLEM